MENETVRDALVLAERRFDESPERIEEGLDVDDPELIQLRRACRLLAAASLLLNRDFYTVVIESSFVAIERTIQFRLQFDGVLEPSEVVSSHRRLYRLGAGVGLYDEAFGDDLAERWDRNRTKTYYRLGVATRPQADAMCHLADELHRHLVGGSRISHECLCSEEG